jgi:hypothetical protein
MRGQAADASHAFAQFPKKRFFCTPVSDTESFKAVVA